MRDARILQDHAGELPRAPAADHPLVERCAAASVVLIGGATHGTHEFHDLRAQVTRRLVEDHGFHAVAIEGSTQLPPWVWRHRAVRSFVDWLHEHNGSVASGVPTTAFVGLDGYDLVDGEESDRAMVSGDHHSWNLREQHMAVTLQALRDRLAEQVDTPRLVVWAHNAHAGDAAATEMGRRGRYTLGQLLRERHPGEVVSVGMTTHTGVVTATHGGGGRPHRMRVLEAIPGSYEELFHAVGMDRFWLYLADEPVREALSDARLERAIGVAYHPEDERARHYFGASLAHQFDIVCHIDRTSALEPLDNGATGVSILGRALLDDWVRREAPRLAP